MVVVNLKTTFFNCYRALLDCLVNKNRYEAVVTRVHAYVHAGIYYIYVIYVLYIYIYMLYIYIYIYTHIYNVYTYSLWLYVYMYVCIVYYTCSICKISKQQQS